MAALRAYFRFAVFALMCVYYTAKLIIMSLLFGQTPKRGMGIRQQWGVNALDAVGVKIELLSPVPDGAHVFVSNHRSYIEGALLPRFVLGAIVIKKEVGNWPILGYGARSSFSIMIDRNDNDSRKNTREQMRTLLAQGYSIIIFPEGTTYAGPGILPLRPGPFQIAEDGGFSCVPVAVEYKNMDDAWVGDDTFVRHFLQSFKKKEVRLKLKFGDPFAVTNWEAGMKHAQDWIHTTTLRMRADFDNETIK